MFVRRLPTAMLVIAVLLYFTDNASSEAINVKLIAERVANDVGQVGETSDSGNLGPIFLFEEDHISRLGQQQIAIMLNRLYLQYDLRRIGVEGSVKPGALDAGWFHQLGGNVRLSTREDIAVRMLGEGEISAAELMTMVYPNIQVFGVEKEDEYNVPFPESSPLPKYLSAIEEKVGSDDPWLKKRRAEALSLYSPKTSVESIIEVLRDIEHKASEVSANIDADTKRKMEELIKAYDTASQRSATMVERTLAIPKPSPDAPVALIIGAAHTDRVLKELKTKNVRYALLTPLALENPYTSYSSQSFEEYDRKSKGYWARTSPGTLGAVLNPKHKLPPIIERSSTHSYASMEMATIIIAEAARAGRKVPEDVLAELKRLPDITIDPKSFRMDGLDVIFSAQLKTPDGEKEVWTRVGTVANAAEGRTLEQRLLQNAADLTGEAQLDSSGGGSQIPPRAPPQGGIKDAEEGPGDYRKNGGEDGNGGREKDSEKDKKPVIERLNDPTLAVHGNRATIDRIGRISG